MVRLESGFTLPELLIGLTILTVGLVGLASVMAGVTRYQELATNRNEMTLLADSKLERLRAAATTNTTDTLELALGGSVTMPTAHHVDTVTSGRGRRFVRLWQVTAGPTGGGTRSVTLRIRPLVDERRTPARLDFMTIILII